MNIRPFANVLRKDGGWSKEFDSRAGGCRVVCFVKVVGNRRLELQLWGDGKHRVSHFLGGRMCTHPTDFHRPHEMLAAIDTELTRTDHPPRDRAKP